MIENTALIKFDNNTALDIKRAAWSSLSEESRKAYQSDFNIFFKFIRKDAKEITADDILKYIGHLEKQEMKNNTINRKLSSLSKMFSVLVLSGEIKNNPIEILKKLKNISHKTSREVKISLTIDDIRKAIVPARNVNKYEQRMALIIRFLSMTGLRVSELIMIKNKDISDFDKLNKKIRIVGKGKKERFIFISNSFLNEIKKLCPDIEQTDHLFYSKRNKRYGRQHIWREIRNIFKRTLGADVHPHTLRHAFITHKISNEHQDIKAVSRYCGHADVSTTLNMYVDKSLDVKSAKIKI